MRLREPRPWPGILGRCSACAAWREIGAPRRRLLLEPGISVVRAAEIAAKVGRSAGAARPDGGRIFGAVYELGVRAGCGILLEADSIPILPETSAVCEALGLDPLRLLASGSMLIAAAPGAGDALVKSVCRHKDRAREDRRVPSRE